MLLHKTGTYATLKPLQGVVRPCKAHVGRSAGMQKLPQGPQTFPFQAGLPSKVNIREVVHERGDIHVQAGTFDEGTKSLLTNGYMVASLLYAASGVAYVAAPQKVVDAVASMSISGLNEYLLRAIGMMSLLMAVFLWALKEAADKGNLFDAATYKRVAWWSVLSSATAALLVARSSIKVTTTYLAVKAILPIALLGLYWKAYEELPLVNTVTGTLSAAQDALQPSNFSAGVFSVLTVLTFAEGLALAISPAKLLEIFTTASLDPLGTLLARLAGLGVLTVSVAAYTLKDAAERGRSGGTPFRNIGGAVGLVLLGIAGNAGFVYADVLKPLIKQKAVMYGGLAVYTLLACYALYTYMTEKDELSLK